ncbi:MAG TPA: formylglycine-generating enzyme family protein [Fuerstia sp.]|nr:formylglycine-generating enzyme family protein [Fuerstiella sp.]
MMIQISVRVICCALLTGMAAGGTDEDDSRPTAKPSGSPEKAIQRFVDECVTITPGKGPYPVKSVIGAISPTEHESARREVTVAHKFRISKFEVTQELYQAVTNQNPSRWKGPRNSVENVSWQDAVGFCTRLTTILRGRDLIGADELVRLPSALEWEYCCRAGTKSNFSFGDDVGSTESDTSILDAHAWHTGNAAGNDPAVGVLKPNPWGLYDVHGYLWEFVSDELPPRSTAGDKRTKETAAVRIIRGGSWKNAHPLLSSSAYSTISDQATSDAIGFRCVIARQPKPKKPRQR